LYFLDLVTDLNSENWAPLSYRVASNGNFLPTFPDNLSVPSSNFNILMLSCYYFITNLKIDFTFNSFLGCDSLFCVGESRGADGVVTGLGAERSGVRFSSPKRPDLLWDLLSLLFKG
jgi:hypothetical protein